jgi:hypothetical protein
MIFRQQARPSEPSIIGIPASDTQGVIQKIQQVTPDDRPTDDSDAPQGTEPGVAIPSEQKFTPSCYKFLIARDC